MSTSQINGNGIPTITPDSRLADTGNWQFDTIRVQPRTRREENETGVLDVTFGDEETNVKVGAVFNKFSRSARTYSTSVGVTQGSSMNQFGYTGPNTLNTFDITNFSRVVPVNYGENFDADPGYRRWTVVGPARLHDMMNPARDRCRRESGLPELRQLRGEEHLLLRRVQQDLRGLRTPLHVQRRHALGEDRAGSHRLRADRGDADGADDAGDRPALERARRRLRPRTRHRANTPRRFPPSTCRTTSRRTSSAAWASRKR